MEEQAMGATSPSEEEMQTFFTENGIDEKAQEVLYSASPVVQRAVLDGGSLADARNPSSALMSRVRDAQNSVVRGELKSGIVHNVDEFINYNGLDEQAIEALTSCSYEVQQIVMERGSLLDARDALSALHGRIRDAKHAVKGCGKGDQSAKKGWMGNIGGGSGGSVVGAIAAAPPESSELLQFINENGLDEKAQVVLFSTSPVVQRAVLAGGSLANAQNPSSAFMSRVRDAQNSVIRGELKSGISHDPDEFLMTNGLDEQAAEALKSCSYEVQQIVMERGSLLDARDALSALHGRIRDAKNAVKGCGKGDNMMEKMKGMMGKMGGGKGGGAASGAGGKVSPAELMQFINANGLDERAQEALHSCPPEVQRVVINRGGLQDARNPSSAVIARIRDAQGGGGKGGGFGGDGGDMWGMFQMFVGMMGKMGKGGCGGNGGFGGKGGWGGGGRSGPYW